MLIDLNKICHFFEKIGGYFQHLPLEVLHEIYKYKIILERRERKQIQELFNHKKININIINIILRQKSEIRKCRLYALKMIKEYNKNGEEFVQDTNKSLNILTKKIFAEKFDIDLKFNSNSKNSKNINSKNIKMNNPFMVVTKEWLVKFAEKINK